MSGEVHADRTVPREQSNGELGNAAIGTEAKLRSLASLVSLFSVPALVAIGLPQATAAQPFDEASFNTLDAIRLNFLGPCNSKPSGQAGCWITPGSNLDRLAFQLSQNMPAGVVSAAPAAVTPQAEGGLAVERRLQAVRVSKVRSREPGPVRAIRASYTGDQLVADKGQLQLPPAAGATPEIVISQAQGFSVFVSAGATALNHHNNRFEDGYEAQLPSVTAGADYWINPRLLGGIAFNYTNFDGTYDDSRRV